MATADVPTTTTTTTTGAGSSAAADDGSIRDGDMLRAIVTGCAVGIPFVFLVLFVIDLAAGLSVPLAALGASIPGVIFGAFIGSALFIGRASDAAQARAGH